VTSAAIDRRAGWQAVGVKAAYIGYQEETDQFVGRLVSGLPVQNAEFALLPPRFIYKDGKQPPIVAEAIKTFFPGFGEDMNRILEFALASLVYHRPWLESILPEKHRVRSTAFFTSDLYEQMKDLVVVCYASADSEIRATGISPGVAQIQRLNQVEHRLDKVNASQEQMIKKFDVLFERQEQLVDVISSKTSQRIVDDLEIRFRDGATVTTGGLDRSLGSLRNEFIQIRNEMLNALKGGSLGSASPPEGPAAQSSSSPLNGLYSFGGALRRLPETFTFPIGKAFILLKLLIRVITCNHY
jgi:hypothetical protein